MIADSHQWPGHVDAVPVYTAQKSAIRSMQSAPRSPATSVIGRVARAVGLPPAALVAVPLPLSGMGTRRGGEGGEMPVEGRRDTRRQKASREEE